MESYDLNTTYFRLNSTGNVFPKFKFTKDNIPVGDSITMCIAMHWGGIEKGENFNLMEKVIGFPNCSQVESGKFIWNENDPTNGIDIPVWIQHYFNADCSDEECDEYCASKYNGFFVDGEKKHVCYSYDVLDGICLVIEYDSVKEKYVYKGGCFKEDSPYLMKPAKLNSIYYFREIEIEVRDKKDPIIVAAEWSKHTYSFGNGWRYFAYFLIIVLIFNLGFLGFVIYTIMQAKQKSNRLGLTGNESEKSNEPI